MLTIDHLAIPSSDPEAAARWLGDILGLTVERDGAEDEFACLRLAARVQLLYTHEPSPAPVHFALRASAEVFARVVARLTAARIAFGNDPERPDNGEMSDPLGGAGRVYFVGPDHHLFEICIAG